MIVILQQEDLWLTQKSLVQLFDVGVLAITKHIKNIYEVGELQMDATISKMEIVQQEGSRMVNRTVNFKNIRSFKTDYTEMISICLCN